MMTGILTVCNVPLLHGDTSPSKLMLPYLQLSTLEICKVFNHMRNLLHTFMFPL